MKKITLSIAAVLLMLTVAKSQDKAFKKGDITIDLGAGVDLYGTKVHQEVLGVQFDTTDGAGGSHFPLKFEYGITNWLGVGARFNFSNFVEETDSITHIKPTTRGMDAGIVANFHLIKSKHFDMPISVNFGYSKFSIQSNDSLSNEAKSGGYSYGISLLPRIYFGEHIGMYFNVGYMGYNYNDIQYSNKYESDLNHLWGDAKVAIRADGVNLGIGLIYKF